MPRICMVTGKVTTVGNNRSHALNATKRKYKVNFATAKGKKRIYDPELKKWVKVRTSTAGLRSLAKALTK